MNVPTIAILFCLGLAVTTAAQSQAQASGSSSKAQLSEVRARVNDLEGATGKLRDLMTQYRTLIDQRPSAGGAQLDSWNSALERLLRRIEKAHAAVVEETRRVDEVAKGELPTSVAKDFVNARNEAEATRGDAEKALTKHKSPPAGKAKTSKKQPPPREEPDSDPLGNL